MIRQTFELPKYDWRVTCYYAVDGYYVDEIMDELTAVGCTGRDAERAYDSLSTWTLDTGLTYSNKRTGRTVIVIQLTSSTKEFVKSWRHEIGHLATHIAEAWGLNLHGEEVQYIGDQIVEEMWGVAHNFLCCKCKEKMREKMHGRTERGGMREMD